MIKVLFNVRPDYLSNPGGDTIQIQKTAEALRGLNIKVKTSPRLDDDLTDYNIVHLFNLGRVMETYLQCQNARKQNKPIALSTIYWNMDEYNTKGIDSLILKAFHIFIKNEKLKLQIHRIKYLFCRKKLSLIDKTRLKIGYKDQQRFVIQNSDVLLPNSEMEMEVIRKDFSLNKKYKVAVNAVDKKFYYASPEVFLENYGKYGLINNNFILCVSRIEDRKNILNFIKAVNDIGIKTIIIGKSSPSQKNYYIKCKNIANQNIVFLDHIAHDDLPSAYAAAKVHVLPSWYETPGLSSLEAGLSGCNIVSTDRGSTKEYFKDFAEYCNPSSIDSIKKAVIKAFHKPKDDRLKIYILKNYTWDRTAEETLEAYKMLLH